MDAARYEGNYEQRKKAPEAKSDSKSAPATGQTATAVAFLHPRALEQLAGLCPETAAHL